MKFPFKVAVITGASGGLGQAMAVELAKRGVKLGLLSRRVDPMQELADTLDTSTVVAACDVADREQVNAAVARVVSDLGPVDCMIANAGTGQPIDPMLFDASTVETIQNVNFMGMVNAFYAVLPDMIERKHGQLVGVSSMAGYQGLPGDAGYAASKAAARTHMESLRISLRGTGVGVTCICPGFVRTPMTDKNDFQMPFLWEADRAGRRMVRAIAKRKIAYNFPWQMNLLVGAGRFVPRWLFDRIVAKRTANPPKRTQAFFKDRER